MDAELLDPLVIGDNDLGYTFVVGRLDDRWLGGAIGAGMLFVFPEITVGCYLGVSDRETAIRMTSAIAQDPEHGYGGITRWRVDPRLRAAPDDFRCRHCGEVCCDGSCRDECEEELT
jgi:hypothetical protein